MRCAAARICSPSLVTRRPSTWRVNSVTPSCASSSLMRRRSAFIDCARLHAADRKLPHWATSRKVRTFSQSGMALPGTEAGRCCMGRSFNGTPLCCRGYIQNLPVHLGFCARDGAFELCIRHFGYMRIFLLTGVVSALSPGIPKADRVTIDFVEITKAEGMRIRLENISVSAQVAKIFELDSIGKFYFLGDGPNHYLLGIERADGVQAFDPRDISLDDLRNFIEGD